MKYSALTFGAVLWDVIGQNEYIGGTSYNLAAHLHQLGLFSDFISAVGTDERGMRVLKHMESIGMGTQMIQQKESLITGYAQVQVDKNGVPSYFIPDNAAFDSLDYPSHFRDHYDVLCFGTFDQRTEYNRKTLQKIWDNVDVNTYFFDVNLRSPYYSKEVIETSLYKTTILKLNEEEVLELSKILCNSTMKEREFFEYISSEYGVNIIVETKGERGCTLFDNNRVIDVPIPDSDKVRVVDTVGSGDAFSAAFLYSYCRGFSTEVCAIHGNRLGSYVAQYSGAVPPLRDELLQKLEG